MSTPKKSLKSGGGELSSASIVGRARSYLTVKRYRAATAELVDPMLAWSLSSEAGGSVFGGASAYSTPANGTLRSERAPVKSMSKKASLKGRRQQGLADMMTSQPGWRKHGSFSQVLAPGKTALRHSEPSIRVAGPQPPRQAVATPAIGQNEPRGVDVIRLERVSASQPGPAAYDAFGLALPKGGTMSTACPKSQVEWEEYRAGQIPGPADYVEPEHLERISGGKFNQSCPKSDVEWKIYRASLIPGPQDYKPKHPRRLSKSHITGGRFNVSEPKSDIEWAEYRAKQIPGPADYRVAKGFNRSTHNVIKQDEQIRALSESPSMREGKFPKQEQWKQYDDAIWS